MALAFRDSRAAQSHEERATAIAADLATGNTPDLVKRFRTALLELRKDPELIEKLHERKDRVFARILPGYAPGGLDRQGDYFVIGPDQQLDAWEAHLMTSDASGDGFQRLYARDFWMT